MNLQEYIRALKSYIASRPPDLGDEDSVLGLLYEAHSESNAMYDDEIKANFHALYEAMNGMPLREMDQIVYPVCTLCGVIRSLDSLKVYGSVSSCALNSEKLMVQIACCWQIALN